MKNSHNKGNIRNNPSKNPIIAIIRSAYNYIAFFLNMIKLSFFSKLTSNFTTTSNSIRPKKLTKPSFDKQLARSIATARQRTTTKPVKLVLYSLGNPGSQYQFTRHNMGHLVLDKLRESFGLCEWKSTNTYSNCVVADDNDTNMVMFKSGTYMNVSGKSLVSNFRKFEQSNADYESILVIVNDELSLPVGKVQLRQRNASPRGHNGLKSVKQYINGDSYLSISIGIGRPESRDQGEVANYVLSKIPKKEMDVVDEVVVPKVAEICDSLMK